jgi:predicted urease superfamily metal-dependent hydrolase
MASEQPPRRNRLRDIVEDALDTALTATDLPSGTIDASAKAIADGIRALRHVPTAEEVASVTTKVLETAGAAAGDAAEAAGKVAEGVLEGIGDIELNLG